MSYIGRGLQSGAFRQLDDISSGFDGSDTTHTMQVNSTNVTVGDVNQILLSLGGVIQKPGTDFTVSSSTLTFTTAPAANTSFFAVLLGSDNGGTVTPTDLSVTTAKIAADNVTPPKTNFFNTDPGNAADLGMLHIKSGDSGASVSSTSDELVIEGSSVGMSFLDATDGATRIAFGDSGDNDIGKIVYGHSSNQMEFVTNAAAGLVISSSGEVTKPLQPMASARPTSAVANITGDGTLAYLGNSIGATERFDVGGCFSNDGMLFVAPITGKYLLCGQFTFSGLASNHTASYFALVTSNQTYYPLYGAELDTVSYLGTFGTAFSIIADMDANDSAQLAVQVYGGSKVVDATTATFLTGMLLA